MKKITVFAVIITLLFVWPATGSRVYADSTPSATSVSKYSISGSNLTVTWKEVSGVTGYQIQYANNRFFLNHSEVDVSDASTTQKTVSKGSMSPCYIRVRTYKTDGDDKSYSKWALSSNCTVGKETILSTVTKSGSTFELRSAAGESTGKYDTLQGGCTYGSTGWFILYNRKLPKCKLVKINMSTMKVIKVSSALAVSHGSSVAYNPDTDQLVVAHGPSNYKRISVIDPDTLTIKKTLTLTLSSSTPGSTASRAKKFKGVTALTYNTTHDVYVGRLKTQSNVVLYDKNFKPVKYIKLSKYDKQLYQGIDSFDDFILISQSANKYGKYNIISVYTFDGKYMCKLKLCKRYEVETIFHRDNALYAGFYRSYYKTYYVSGFKIKVVNGKKNKVKTKLKYTRLVRDNYFYKVTSL